MLCGGPRRFLDRFRQAKAKAGCTVTDPLPTMMTGGTDMAQVRARGVQCYGIGPMTDVEDTLKGWHAQRSRVNLEEALHICASPMGDCFKSSEVELTMTLSPTLEHYKIISKIGAGGMAQSIELVTGWIIFTVEQPPDSAVTVASSFFAPRQQSVRRQR